LKRLSGIAALVLMLPLISPISFHQKPQTPMEELILFAVWSPQTGKLYFVDPIARIQGSRLTRIIPDGGNWEVALDQFEKQYLTQGRVFPLLFGGSQYGTITVDKSGPTGCQDLMATAKVSRPIPSGLNGLAVSSVKGILLHDNWRHLASADQKSMFVRLAIESLMSQGAKAIAPGELAVGSLRASRLGKDQPEVLIGSASFKEKTRIRDLFLMITFQGEKPRILLSSYHESKDIENGEDRQEESFLDQVDFDGDGVDEIVTLSRYYESSSYAVYKDLNGEWQRIYEVGIGGC
jgi:hypothetical protein